MDNEPRFRGRPLRDVLRMLRTAPRPDPQFADDLEAILASVDDVPSDDPWSPRGPSAADQRRDGDH